HNESFFAQALMYAIAILLYTQRYWQLGIMLRTISVKSKIKFSGKLIISLAIIVWLSLSSQALLFLINVAYKAFGLLYGA
ncbi:MAG: hypothetical protein PHP79_09975, partial [Clostridia bacterium]|nr:hypothetical protein [Clostridia bacterium]